jgi:hypothetical protein
MKNIISVFIFLSFFVMMSELSFSATTITTTTTITVTRADPGGSPPFKDCPFPGTGCTLQTTTTTTTTTPITIDQVSGMWVINANVGPIVGKIGTVQFSVIDRSLVFPTGATLTIIHSDEYPQLDNTVIPLAGIATDSNGNYSVAF